jgi:hypothetical protein
MIGETKKEDKKGRERLLLNGVLECETAIQSRKVFFSCLTTQSCF